MLLLVQILKNLRAGGSRFGARGTSAIFEGACQNNRHLNLSYGKFCLAWHSDYANYSPLR
jgi:hypothetical protein